jgi:hypothetical protein
VALDSRLEYLDLRRLIDERGRLLVDRRVLLRAHRAAGRRLRTEIYEPGDSRDVNVSIEKFLGRQRSIEPFLKKIGIGSSPTR